MKNQKSSAQTADVNLRLDWCSYKAAKFAVEHWHYSKTMPVGKTLKIGVWECGRFIGVVIFSNAVGAQSAKSLSMTNFELCELVRVALTKHITPVSRIIKISIKKLKKYCPRLRCIVSFADPQQKHRGGIYQAGNWVYVGESTSSLMYKIGDKIIHSRTANPNNKHFGTKSKDIDISNAIKFFAVPKFKYLYPLDKAMRKQIEPLRQPYPKKCGSLVEGQRTPSVDGGATPTLPLHNK